MGSRDAGNFAVRAGGRHSEWVAFALHDEGRDFDIVELGEAALFGPARRVERECKAEDADRFGLGRGAARNPRPQRSTAGQNREAAEGAVT
jgi:hypothetical protein